jgi:hypothetical protein
MRVSEKAFEPIGIDLENMPHKLSMVLTYTLNIDNTTNNGYFKFRFTDDQGKFTNWFKDTPRTDQTETGATNSFFNYPTGNPSINRFHMHFGDSYAPVNQLPDGFEFVLMEEESSIAIKDVELKIIPNCGDPGDEIFPVFIITFAELKILNEEYCRADEYLYRTNKAGENVCSAVEVNGPRGELNKLDWGLVFRQTAGLYQAPDKWIEHNAENPYHKQYSILNQLETMRRTDGNFLFKLVWPKETEDNTQIWIQTTNPVTATSGGVEGYEAVEAPFDTKGWGGLQKNMNGNCLLDGCVD